MIGVSAETLASRGTVSEDTAKEMAEGTLAHSRTQAMECALEGLLRQLT